MGQITLQRYVEHYNRALAQRDGYITPTDMLARRQKEILEARDRMLEQTRARGFGFRAL